MKTIRRKENLKILFVSPLPPPHYGSAISSEMCRNILEDSSDIQVKSIRINYSEKMSDIGRWNLSKAYGFFFVLMKIFFLNVKFKPDIIYFVPATSSLGLIRDGLFIYLINTIRTGKLVVHLRSRFIEKDFGHPIKGRLIKELLNCDTLILIGEELASNLGGFENSVKMVFLPNAIPATLDDKELVTIRGERKANKIIQILFLSNMVEAKGYFKVLQSCMGLKQSGIGFSCHFAGEWGSSVDETRFWRYVKKYNLEENVCYHGRIIGDDKTAILKKVDLLIFPTEYQLETFGRVVIEAMEFEIPVIANGIGTIPSIIEHGRTGFILKENTPEEIEFYVTKLLDVELRLKMGAMGREKFLQRYTLDVFKEKFRKIFVTENENKWVEITRD